MFSANFSSILIRIVLPPVLGICKKKTNPPFSKDAKLWCHWVVSWFLAAVVLGVVVFAVFVTEFFVVEESGERGWCLEENVGGNIHFWSCVGANCLVSSSMMTVSIFVIKMIFHTKNMKLKEPKHMASVFRFGSTMRIIAPSSSEGDAYNLCITSIHPSNN